MEEFVAHDTRIDFEVECVVLNADICGARSHLSDHDVGQIRNEVVGRHFILQALGYHDTNH